MKLVRKALFLLLALVFALVIVIGYLLIPKPIFYKDLQQVSMSQLEPGDTLTIEYYLAHWGHQTGRVIIKDGNAKIGLTPVMRKEQLFSFGMLMDNTFPTKRTVLLTSEDTKDLDMFLDTAFDSDHPMNKSYCAANFKITLRKPQKIPRTTHIKTGNCFNGHQLHCIGLGSNCGYPDEPILLDQITRKPL